MCVCENIPCSEKGAHKHKYGTPNNCCLNSPNQVQIKSADSDIAHQVGESTIVIVQSLRGRRADLLDVGESTLDIGEQTVGKTTVIRNSDRAA